MQNTRVFWSENKITLKRNIEKTILSDKNLSKAYLEVIQDECMGKTLKEVMGADSNKIQIVGEYFSFIKKLLAVRENQSFNRSLLKTKEGNTSGEFGERLMTEINGVNTDNLRRKTVYDVGGRVFM